MPVQKDVSTQSGNSPNIVSVISSSSASADSDEYTFQIENYLNLDAYTASPRKRPIGYDSHVTTKAQAAALLSAHGSDYDQYLLTFTSSENGNNYNGGTVV